MPVETERPEPLPVRTIPYSGMHPRPIATATLRPRTLEQRRSEGQIETQSQDDINSEESDTLEPLVMEGLPDELGPEWRILHPFEIPGVRNPTEDTPPTHRRLAENDTLVELIQTAEYLEDAPSWEQRRFYPPRYGDPYYRGHGRGCGRGRGRGRGWLNEDVTERDTGGGWGRFYARGNGRNGQDRNGFPPSTRRDIRLELPPEPEPSRLTDWSSIASPPATFPHGMPGISTEPSGNVQNQLNVPAAIGTRQERDKVGISEGVTIAPQQDVLREDQGIQARSSPHAEDVMTSAPQRSSTNDERPRHSQLRSHTIEDISSICPVDSSIASGIRQMALDDRGHGPPRTSTVYRRDSSDSSDTDRVPRRRGYSNERGRPPERERYPSRGGLPDRGRPPDRLSRGPPDDRRGPPDDRGGPPDRGRPPDRGGLPSGGGPPDDGGLPDDGGPPSDGGSSSGNGGPPRHPNRRGTPGPRGPPGPVRPVLIQQPQVALDTTALENTFDNMGQSMLQLARVQDQTNRHLQQHIQQDQLNMQAHAGALHELANSTHQRNYDHIFASIPVYDGSNRDDFFPWLDHLEAAFYHCGRDIKTEALGRSAGPVQNVIMALPQNKPWSAIREELKHCFSDQISLGHTASQLENMTQKPNEPLRLYIYRYSKLHKAVTQKDAAQDTDPSRWFRFLTSITNTSIADKVT